MTKIKIAILGHNWIYTPEYYEAIVEGPASQSAGVIAETIFTELNPASVIDVGCGTGALLEKFLEKGCEVLGLEYSKAALKYCRSRNLPVIKFNLETDRISRGDIFDVAISMEVAEHLPEKTADQYVELLTRFANIIVFTAAQPGQGGTDHVNEQPHDYWIAKFQKHGFRVDEGNSQKWQKYWITSGEVQQWYYENLMIFRKD